MDAWVWILIAVVVLVILWLVWSRSFWRGNPGRTIENGKIKNRRKTAGAAPLAAR